MTQADLEAYYTGKGCNPGYPPADERAEIDKVARLEAARYTAQQSCYSLTGPSQGGCLSSVAEGYAKEIAAAKSAFMLYCGAKYAHTNPPCPPLPARNPVPAVPNSPLSAGGRNGQTCPGLSAGPEQALLARYAMDQWADMQNKTGACRVQYEPLIAAEYAKACGDPAVVKGLETSMFRCMNAVVDTYTANIAKLMNDLDYYSCSQLSSGSGSGGGGAGPSDSTATNVNVNPDGPSGSGDDLPPVYVPTVTTPVKPVLASSTVVGGILFLVAIGVGYAGYRAVRKGKR
jgi:hypothetical protein